MSATKARSPDKVAISYVRFSRPEQIKGDSLRRQKELSRAWCERNGYFLDESVKYHDLGVSAFKGKNATQGKLGALLEAIKKGKIRPGTVLLIESLDRLSRAEIGEALELFLGILRSGINIVTLQPEETFTKESTNDLVKLIIALVIISRAYEESNTKSVRIRQAWDKKRELAQSGKRMTKQAPVWLRVTKDGEWEKPNPKAVDAINLMFKLKDQGMGIVSITRHMNKHSPWMPEKRVKGNKWKPGTGFHTAFVKATLQNPAVIGRAETFTMIDGKRTRTKDPPIEGYYPRIVDEKLFFSVQKKFEANRGKGGRWGKVQNLFRHLVKCAYCGGSMTTEKHDVLLCLNGKRGKGCDRHRINYSECEDVVLENCRGLRPEDVLPDPAVEEALCRDIRKELNGVEAELASINDQLAEGTKELLVPDTSDRNKKRIREHMANLDAQQNALEFQKVEIKERLSVAERNRQSLQAWSKTYDDLRKALKTGGPEIRVRMQSHLRDIIEKIEIFSRGHRKMFDPNAAEEARRAVRKRLKAKRLAPQHLRQPEILDADDGECLAEKLAEWVAASNRHWRPDRAFRQFQNELTSRRMSKEGRFVRVRFKTGAVVDLVPPGSIASGVNLVPRRDKTAWVTVDPPVGRLWRDFSKTHQKPKSMRRKRNMA